MRRCADAGSDARELVQPGARFSVLAIGNPGEQKETAADDHDRRAKPDPHPDAVEDHDAEHPEKKQEDGRTGELEGVAHRPESTSARADGASGGRNAP
jgi:hypothetical protein